MIKAEYNKKTEDMVIDIEGDLNIALNEYSAITQSLFESLSRVAGENEAKEILKKAYKIGLKRAMKKEGKEID